MKIKRTTILYVMNTIVSSFVSSDSYASDNERSDFRSFENNQSNIQFSENNQADSQTSRFNLSDTDPALNSSVNNSLSKEYSESDRWLFSINDFYFLKSYQPEIIGAVDFSDKKSILQAFAHNFMAIVKYYSKLIKSINLSHSINILKSQFKKIKTIYEISKAESQKNTTFSTDERVDFFNHFFLDLKRFRRNNLSLILQLKPVLEAYNSYCKIIVDFENEVFSELDREFTFSFDGKLEVLQNQEDYQDVIIKYNYFLRNNIESHLMKVYKQKKNYMLFLKNIFNLMISSLKTDKLIYKNIRSSIMDKHIIFDMVDLPSFYCKPYKYNYLDLNSRIWKSYKKDINNNFNGGCLSFIISSYYDKIIEKKRKEYNHISDWDNFFNSHHTDFITECFKNLTKSELNDLDFQFAQKIFMPELRHPSSLYSIIENYNILYGYQNLLYSTSNYITDFFAKMSKVSNFDVSNLDFKSLLNSEKYSKNLKNLLNQLFEGLNDFENLNELYNNLKYKTIIVTFTKDLKYAESKNPSLLNFLIDRAKVLLKKKPFPSNNNEYDNKSDINKILNQGITSTENNDLKHEKYMNSLGFLNSYKTNFLNVSVNNSFLGIGNVEKANNNSATDDFIQNIFFNNQERFLINNGQTKNYISIQHNNPLTSMIIPRVASNNIDSKNFACVENDVSLEVENSDKMNHESILGKRSSREN